MFGLAGTLESQNPQLGKVDLLAATHAHGLRLRGTALTAAKIHGAIDRILSDLKLRFSLLPRRYLSDFAFMSLIPTARFCRLQCRKSRRLRSSHVSFLGI